MSITDYVSLQPKKSQSRRFFSMNKFIKNSSFISKIKMINKSEILYILLTTLILTFVVAFTSGVTTYLYTFLIILAIIAINVAAKKFLAYHLDAEIEIKIWESSFPSNKPKGKYTKPIPTGLLIPFIIGIISLGYVKWLASLVFDVKPKVYRAAKRHGLYTFSEMTEYQIGLIAAVGILANLLFAIIGYLIGIPAFAKYSIFYATWNMLPIANLDGNKIFFGNIVMWSFLAAITLIGLVYAIIL